MNQKSLTQKSFIKFAKCVFISLYLCSVFCAIAVATQHDTTQDNAESNQTQKKHLSKKPNIKSNPQPNTQTSAQINPQINPQENIESAFKSSLQNSHTLTAQIAIRQPYNDLETTLPSENTEMPKILDSHKDLLLLQGADDLYHSNFAESLENFLLLYDETKEPYYAKLAAQAAIGTGDINKAFSLANLYIEQSGDDNDPIINKILADAFVQNGEMDKAIIALEKVKKVEETDALNDVLANLYMLQKQLPKALNIFGELYTKTKSPEVLKKILVIFLSQDKSQQALGLLSEHLISEGCEEGFCEEALSFYVDSNALNMAKAVFETIYKKAPTIPNATNYMRVLVALKQYQEAQGIAQSFPFDQGLLLDLYVMQGDFEKARDLSAQIYAKSKNPRFLALEAIYGLGENDIAKDSAIEAAKKLEKAIKERKKELQSNKQKPTNQDAFFYNFCGYLMIDFDIDIKKGIEYVKEALLVEPYSISYIDSLAWGYYKLGDCVKASATFAQIPQNRIDKEAELKAHSTQINTCKK